MILTVVGAILPWFIVTLGCWLGYQLVRQNGRILLRLEALEERLGELQVAPSAAPVAAPSAPAGLPVGGIAPAFELPDLTGTRQSLSQFRGKRLLLIFFNPGCGFCTQMAGDLAALPTDGANGRPVPLVVSTGDAAANRTLVQEHGIRCLVLLQERMEVASQYQAHGTPMGYLIDEQGQIASEIAVGAPALLALADGQSAGAGVNGNSQHGPRGNRDLADSKLRRDGLPAGTPAPPFTLPGLDGEELSLSRYGGREVVLVFSDPGCGPCNQIAPDLEQFHRRTGAAQVVMVSRGALGANRLKAQEHGLTYPIGLQKQWEVSRDYAMFATPIAYRVTAEGAIAEAVGVGVEAIRGLLARIEAEGAASAAARAGGCPCGKRRGKCGCARKEGGRVGTAAVGSPPSPRR